ncbi:hypothetical protein MtrunA17_Chr4g0025261 [Medicago truncatula]|uniref:Uncharacterized protein n=1 Tax=Medicago truncatula TaxID=3880 RepID=A0A396I430_MEDTR|nr:hypothetical protein MtrunA17_Chr4g0025261 [Medicago truncatula]
MGNLDFSTLKYGHCCKYFSPLFFLSSLCVCRIRNPPLFFFLNTYHYHQLSSFLVPSLLSSSTIFLTSVQHEPPSLSSLSDLDISRRHHPLLPPSPDIRSSAFHHHPFWTSTAGDIHTTTSCCLTFIHSRSPIHLYFFDSICVADLRRMRGRPSSCRAGGGTKEKREGLQGNENKK